MTALIDLSIINSVSNTQYQAAALASAQALGSAVNLFSVHNAPSILSARLQCLAQGTAPYVTWLDGDDTVMNIAPVTAALASNPAALFTNCNVINAAGVVQHQFFAPTFNYDKQQFFAGRQAPHQLVVIKRAILPPVINGILQCAAALGHLNTKFWPVDTAIYFEIALAHNWIYLDDICYNWREYSNSQSHVPGAQYVNAITQYYQNKLRG